MRPGACARAAAGSRPGAAAASPVAAASEATASEATDLAAVGAAGGNASAAAEATLPNEGAATGAAAAGLMAIAAATGAPFAAGFASSSFSRAVASSVVAEEVSLSDFVESGCECLQPSRYKAVAFSPSSQLRRYARLMSSTLDSFGRLMVFEMAPLMKGCAAAIMRM